MSVAGALLLGLALEVLIGWPEPLFRRIGHPVTWIGHLVSAGEAALNRPHWADAARRLAGAALALSVTCAAGGMAWVAAANLPEGALGTVLGGVLAWPALAARSLGDHVRDVARPLARGDLAGARRAVARIVGRDPSRLDGAGVGRAAIESLAENASDGVVAPIFWGVLLGLPGLWGYKAVNTLDSMIGYRTERHRAFGWAAARLDDLANLVPARLTALLFALAGGRPKAALAVARADAHRHRSPNAGWPEAAMAGAIGVRLSGPRIYATGPTDDPFVNASAPDPDASDITRALRVYRRMVALLAAGLAGLWLMGV